MVESKASVQKYDMHSKDGTWDDNYEMRAEQHGDYVTYDDYESLENDYNILRRESLLLLEKQQAMMDKLKDIWVEG